MSNQPAKSNTKKPHAMSSEQVSESNAHHERRFAQIDRDIFSVKTDVGVLQADVKTLASGQIALQESQDRGFRDVKDTLLAKSQEQPKITVAMLVSLFGVLITIVAVGVGAFWSVVLLLADPIKADLLEHKASTQGNNKDIALLEERARQMQMNLEARHLTLAGDISKLATAVSHLDQQSVEAARLEGRINALEEVRRLNEQRTCDRIGILEKLHQSADATP
jgi:hypothetical protein